VAGRGRTGKLNLKSPKIATLRLSNLSNKVKKRHSLATR